MPPKPASSLFKFRHIKHLVVAAIILDYPWPANRDRADQRKQRRSRSTNLCAEIHNRMSVILGPEQRRSAAVIDVPFAAIAGGRPISAGTIPMSPVLGVIWACGDHARQSSPAGIARPEHQG
jgi:hypothetical protein